MNSKERRILETILSEEQLKAQAEVHLYSDGMFYDAPSKRQQYFNEGHAVLGVIRRITERMAEAGLGLNLSLSSVPPETKRQDPK